jgi:DNA-directed RNA polymerase specialized sigma24 family protein
MNKDWILTQESFDALLGWLDPEREKAGRKYEEIRLRLIKLFTCRSCHEPEDLADETINRVTRKLNEIETDFKGDRVPYFYAVGNNVFMEYLRRRLTPPPPPTVVMEKSDVEREFACLERCLAALESEQRELVLNYYQEEKLAKINRRKLLAEKLGIAPNALRIRAYRIRAALQKCVEKCLDLKMQ